MDFVKVFDQTVREIKREVNLKVLKIPEIEQKVLDATSDEPWGPHGSALSEIAQATKKITEFQMIMNVLWTRLSDTGANWRHVYKALAVIEYLVANGSERALDDILDCSHRIAAISDFQYIEPNGKDVGINVRKKVETILALLHDKEKIQEVRNKAAINHHKYFGLSSTGITYKSSSASHGGSNFNQNDHYGSLSCGKDGSFKDSYRDRERSGGEMERKHEKRDSYNKSPETFSKENEENKSKKGVRLQSRNQDSLPSVTPKPLPKPGSALSATSSAQPSPNEDDFDDFDPRGSSTAGSANASFNQVDLFGQNIVGDLMDAPAPVSTEKTTLDSAGTPVRDLFANATFVSASPHVEQTSSQTQGNIGLFANQPANPAAFSSNMDFFAPPDPGLPSETKSSISEPTNTKNFDPFASMPLNTFDESDMFGAFTSHTNPPAMESPQSSAENCLNNLDKSSSSTSKPAAKKDTFQVKSGIWADSLSRGLIDLNITASKKTSLADIGIVMGLGDGPDDKEKGPPTSMFMGRAMRPGSGLGMSGFASSTATMGNEGFSTLGQQQFGSFK